MNSALLNTQLNRLKETHAKISPKELKKPEKTEPMLKKSIISEHILSHGKHQRSSFPPKSAQPASKFFPGIEGLPLLGIGKRQRNPTSP